MRFSTVVVEKPENPSVGDVMCVCVCVVVLKGALVLEMWCVCWFWKGREEHNGTLLGCGCKEKPKNPSVGDVRFARGDFVVDVCCVIEEQLILTQGENLSIEIIHKLKKPWVGKLPHNATHCVGY